MMSMHLCTLSMGKGGKRTLPLQAACADTAPACDYSVRVRCSDAVVAELQEAADVGHAVAVGGLDALGEEARVAKFDASAVFQTIAGAIGGGVVLESFKRWQAARSEMQQKQAASSNEVTLTIIKDGADIRREQQAENREKDEELRAVRKELNDVRKDHSDLLTSIANERVETAAKIVAIHQEHAESITRMQTQHNGAMEQVHARQDEMLSRMRNVEAENDKLRRTIVRLHPNDYPDLIGA